MAREFKKARDWAFLYEDALLKLVEDGVSSYSVGGQTFTKNDIKFLQGQYSYWKAEAEAEDAGFDGTALVDQS